MHGRRQLDLGAQFRAGLAARVLAAVLCGAASTVPATAQTIHANLETAVAAFTEALVWRGDLRGRRVIVGPRYFHDEVSKRRLPLSEFLSRQFQAKLLAHGVTPVEPGGSEDEDRMMVLHGRWRLLDDGLHLTAHVREPIVDGSGTVASAPPAPVRDFDESLLALDLDFLGRDMVRQLEGGIRDGRRRTIRVGEFTVEGEGVGDTERVQRYLMARWLRPAFRDSLFTLRSGVSGGGEGDGLLFVYAWATPAHLEVSMYVEGAGERVPSATVDVPVELVSVIGGPDVGAILARCEGHVEEGRLREAWRCYGEVPETAAGREGVRVARERIEERYATRVRAALGAEDLETAQRVVGELSGLIPRPGSVSGLEAEVAQADEAAQRARLVREEAQRRAEERRAAAEAEARRKREEEPRGTTEGDDRTQSLTPEEWTLVQHALGSLGFDPGLVDGYVGPKTREALRSWQKRKGYPATGTLSAEQSRILFAVGRTVQAKARQDAEAARRAEDARRAEEARQRTEAARQAEEARKAEKARRRVAADRKREAEEARWKGVDQLIETQMRGAISGDWDLKSRTRINVTSFNGVLLLTGEAPGESLRNRITEAARVIPRVQWVQSEIALEAPSTRLSQAHDAATTAAVRAALLEDAELGAVPVKVVTARGVVYLMGLVTRDEADRATVIARRVVGVQRVVNVMQYIR